MKKASKRRHKKMNLRNGVCVQKKTKKKNIFGVARECAEVYKIIIIAFGMRFSDIARDFNRDNIEGNYCLVPVFPPASG